MNAVIQHMLDNGGLKGRVKELYECSCIAPDHPRPCTAAQCAEWQATIDGKPCPKGLGDFVESALSAVGITKERVERLTGKPCGCEERKQKLNALTWRNTI